MLIKALWNNALAAKAQLSKQSSFASLLNTNIPMGNKKGASGLIAANSEVSSGLFRLFSQHLFYFPNSSAAVLERRHIWCRSEDQVAGFQSCTALSHQGAVALFRELSRRCSSLTFFVFSSVASGSPAASPDSSDNSDTQHSGGSDMEMDDQMMTGSKRSQQRLSDTEVSTRTCTHTKAGFPSPLVLFTVWSIASIQVMETPKCEINYLIGKELVVLG